MDRLLPSENALDILAQQIVAECERRTGKASETLKMGLWGPVWEKAA